LILRPDMASKQRRGCLRLIISSSDHSTMIMESPTWTSWSYFPTAFAIPSRNKEWHDTILYTLHRCIALHTTYQHLCCQPSVLSRPYFSCRGRLLTKDNHCSSSRPCTPALFKFVLSAYPFWGISPSILCKIHHRHPSIWHHVNRDRNIYVRSKPMASLSPHTRYLKLCERKKMQLSSLAHTKSHR
jgi:hypothetical protein